eukprot:SAG25_NODE_878_length_4974_cov_1.376615_2_plen_78_part_00
MRTRRPPAPAHAATDLAAAAGAAAAAAAGGGALADTAPAAPTPQPGTLQPRPVKKRKGMLQFFTVDTTYKRGYQPGS